MRAEVEKAIGQLIHRMEGESYVAALPMLNRCSLIIGDLERRLKVAKEALTALNESKCMNAWGHMTAGDALRAIEKDDG